jgi:hypothetical protein
LNTRSSSRFRWILFRFSQVPLVPGCRAADEVGRDHGISAAAAGALYQAGEYVSWSPTVAKAALHFAAILFALGLDGGLPCFRGPPEFVVDNSQLWHLLYYLLSGRIWSRLSFACIRVFDEALPVPDNSTDVHFVVQDAVAALGVAVDGTEAPVAAAWRRDTLLVQLGRDSFADLPTR